MTDGVLDAWPKPLGQSPHVKEMGTNSVLIRTKKNAINQQSISLSQSGALEPKIIFQLFSDLNTML